MVGTVTHYFGRFTLAALRLSEQPWLGDHLHALGSTSDLESTVTWMQRDHESSEAAEPRREPGLQVVERARCGETVYRVP